jgi:hypothetical protein
MQELKHHIRKNGYDYYFVEKTDAGYIYRQEDNGKVIAFEVFKRKENTQFNCISFPGNEAFGSWAWTYRTYEDAKKRLNKISELISEKSLSDKIN